MTGVGDVVEVAKVQVAMEVEEEGEGEKAVGGEESPLSEYRRSLLPGGERESSPMDLSSGTRAQDQESDTGSESSHESIWTGVPTTDRKSVV